MPVLTYNPEVLSGNHSVWHCSLAYQPQKLPESWYKAPSKKKKKKKSKQNASLYLTSLFFCSSKMLNNRQFYWMGIIVWVLTIWSSRKIDLLPYRLECFSWVKNNDSINQKLFSYLPVAYLVHLDGMEIYLGMSQHTGGKINFGK